jgi:tetratricopeptide (TPR) repeat protein
VQRTSSRTRHEWWRPALLVAVILGAYSNAFNGPFIFDDQLTVIENTSIHHGLGLQVLTPERELPVAGRPLVNASFAVNYALNGPTVFGYHAANIAIHVAAALLLFLLVRHALALWTGRPPWLSPATVALLTALLWGVHPLNTEAVDYVTQRTELLLGVCYLLTLYASLRAVNARGPGWPIVAVMACAAGMACKESMVTAPIAVALVDAVLVFGSIQAALRARGRLYASLACTWVLLGVVMWSGPRVHSAGFDSGVTAWTYLMNQPAIIARYIRLALWPGALVAVYGWPAAISIGQVWPYGLLIAALVVVTCVALYMRPPLGALGAWFFITLAPTSSIIPIATEVGAERRMYLPLLAIVLLAVASAAWVADRLVGRTARARPVAVAIAFVAIAALSVTTYIRNRDYSSPVRLTQTAVDRRPNDVARHFLGSALIEAGRRNDGIEELKRATATDPRSYYDLGNAYFEDGKLDDALRELDQFVRRQPALLEVVSARRTMGRVYAIRSQWARAIEQYKLVRLMSRSDVDVRGLLADAYLHTEAFPEAIDEYRAYLRVRPATNDALDNLGYALVAVGRLDEAIGVFRQAVTENPRDAVAGRNLALALFDHGETAQAADAARRALTLTPNDEVIQDVLQRATAAAGAAVVLQPRVK